MGMLVALFGNLLGMLGGALPDIFKFLTTWQNHKNELAMMEAQHRWQLEAAKVGASARMDEWGAVTTLEANRQLRDQTIAAIEASSKPTGIVWVDTLNALMRPICTYGVMLMFFFIAVPFSYVIVSKMLSDTYSPEMAAKAIFGTLIGDSILGCLSFLYGYRSTSKR